MTLNERIREYCYKNRISQKEFAKRTGISQATVSRLVHDGKPTFLNMKKISAIIGTPLLDLIDEHYRAVCE